MEIMPEAPAPQLIALSLPQNQLDMIEALIVNVSQLREELRGRAWQTESSLCKNLDVSPSTLRKWRDQGLPFTQIGEVRRYNTLQVDEWLKRHQPRHAMAM